MKLIRFCRPVPLIACLALSLRSGAAPIANPESYSIAEDGVLTITAPGVLANDNANGATGTLSAAKTGEPAHGTVVLQPNGSFVYTPAADYHGPDSFQYKVVEGQGPVSFTVDQNTSVLTINVQTNVSGTTDSKTTTAKAKGSMTAALTPTQAPFSTAQIRTINIATAERVSVELCVAELFVCIGWIGARIEPDGLLITMREDQAGPAVSVDGSGNFTQTGNFIDTTGTIFLSTRGAASVVTVPPSADLNQTNLAYDFTNASIVQNGATLTLAVPIDLTQSIVDPSYTATVHVTGTIHATAPVPAASVESPPTTVSIDVTSVDDPPTAVTDRYYTRQNYPINIPAAGSQPVTETLIAAGSSWKYSTGASLGTAWRATDYVDTAWQSDNGPLGYDADILPNTRWIPQRADMVNVASPTNPNYPTAYFRREFMVTAAGATTEAKIEFQRDDACIIYVNGTEVYRDSTAYTAGGAAPFAATGEIAYATYAAASISEPDSVVYKSVSISPSLLREGRNVISAEVHQASATSSDLRFDLKCTRVAEPTEALASAGGVWKYATGSDLGTAWRNPEFNDATWQSAAGPLGYDTDIPAASTIPARANMAAAASAANPNFPTAYFRREFTLTAPFDTIVPRVEFQRDDGCIIYVNGVEIYRDSTAYVANGVLPFPASGEIPYSQYCAANIPENESLAYKVVTFSRSLLREGRNVIAAEVHQNTNVSSDLRFDLRAYRTTGVGGVAFNDTDTDGPATHVVVHSPPAHGSVTLNPDGSFTYTPAPGFPDNVASGTDSFVYKHTVAGQPVTSSAVIVPMGSTWKYLDTGVAAPEDAGITPADWRNAAFDDALWGTGDGKLGYGDPDVVSVVEDDATPGSPTAGSTTRHITTYFRRKFNFAGSTDLLNSLKVRIIRDDGVAVFLNGTRIAKDNLPDGWTATTLASTSINGAAETQPLEVLNIPASALYSGENILAVEVHQSARDSSDLGFDLELSAESVAGARVEIVVLSDDIDSDDMSDMWERSSGLNPNLADGSLDADGDGQSNRAEFLAGTNPLLVSSSLRPGTLTQPNPLQLQLSFESVPGRVYQLQRSDSLNAWADTGATIPAHATNAETIVQFPKPSDAFKFYRLRVVNDWR